MRLNFPRVYVTDFDSTSMFRFLSKCYEFVFKFNLRTRIIKGTSD